MGRQHLAHVEGRQAVEGVGGGHQGGRIGLGMVQQLAQLDGAGTSQNAGECPEGPEAGETLAGIEVEGERPPLISAVHIASWAGRLAPLWVVELEPASDVAVDWQIGFVLIRKRRRQ